MLKRFTLLLFVSAACSTFAESTEKDDDEVVKSEVDDVKPWKKFDFHGREDFLKTLTLSEEAKTEFQEIKKSQNMRKSVKTQKLRDWAKKYDVEEKMEEHITKKEANHAKFKENRKTDYKRLGELLDDAEEIVSSDEFTWSEVQEKINELIEKESHTVKKAFRSFYPFFGEHGKGEHHHSHGKRRPRNIGHGAYPKHSQPHQIGHGIEPHGGHRNHEGSNRNYDPYRRQEGRHHL